MNKVLLVIMVLFGLSVSSVFGAEITAALDQPAILQADQPIEVGNKICPVSGEEIGKSGMAPHQVVYKGKVYHLCCSMCEEEFNKDPEKYSKIAEDEVKSIKE